MPTPPPSLSTRLGDVRSSPVRDILELTQRAEVISFAGRLPAPELFPAELIAGAFAQALAPTVAALLRTALEHDVAFVPGFPFFALEADHRTLRLSFTTHVAAEGPARLGRASAP